MAYAGTAVRVFGTTFVVSLLVGVACHVPWVEGSHLCQPSSSKPDKRCPDDEICCSDDPAALDFSRSRRTRTPSIRGPRRLRHSLVLGRPKRRQLLRRVHQIGDWVALPSGCPVPCNPSWDSDSVDAICGTGTFCCQTLEVDGVGLRVRIPRSVTRVAGDQFWRRHHGTRGGLDATSWFCERALDPARSRRATSARRGSWASPTRSSTDASATAGDVQVACLRRLGVANQRGFCIIRWPRRSRLSARATELPRRLRAAQRLRVPRRLQLTPKSGRSAWFNLAD